MPISELCEKYGIHPSLFYRWEKDLFEGGLSIFAGHHRKNNGRESVRERRYQEKIQKMQEVISWLTEENIRLKKERVGRFE